jgi:hypothetical protein
MGLISDLMKQGAMLILIDVQRDYVHFSDSIFARDRLPYTPIDESLGIVISCSESREFLLRAGISGEIIHTHSHSEDSVSLIMDDGDCIVGDLEPFEYIEVYEEKVKIGMKGMSGKVKLDSQRVTKNGHMNLTLL